MVEQAGLDPDRPLGGVEADALHVFEDPDPKKMKKLITMTKRNAAKAVRRKRREHGFPPIRNFGWVIQKRVDMYDAVQVTHQFQMFI